MPLAIGQPQLLTPRIDAGLGDVAQRFPGTGASSLNDIEWLTRGRRRGLRPLEPEEDRAKRLLDIVCAIGLMIVTSPLLLLAALAVAITSRGPIIYTQVRTGLNRRGMKQPDRRQRTDSAPPGGIDRRSLANPDRRASRAFGRPFTIYKLRTMRTDAERDGAQFARIGDARITAVGRFLRRTRIDELPQLWNVLRGDMSIVGPRPERPEFIGELSKEVPGYLDRLGIKPGLTGLAQVLNGYDADLDAVRRKVRLDLLYLEHYSVAADIKILLRTVGVVLRGTGAR